MDNLLERFAIGCFKLAAKAKFAQLDIEASIPPRITIKDERLDAARAWAEGRTGGIGVD